MCMYMYMRTFCICIYMELCLYAGVSTVGRAGSKSHDIQLTGALVAEDHWLDVQV